MRNQFAFLVIMILAPLGFLRAEIRLPSVLASHMVLQQNSTVKIWGWSAPAEKILIQTSWNNKLDSTVGTRDANWSITIQTPAAGGPYTISLTGENKIILEDIMVGEVWVCSGQSNMEWGYRQGLKDIRDELPTCYNPSIRFFNIQKSTADYPQENCPGDWAVCDSNSLKSFSAIGYFFGKKLNSELNVPIGLINDNWGGTPAEVWTPAQAIAGNQHLEESARQLKAYNWWPYLPGKAYNAMIAPITNFPIAGALWYQGEGNTIYPYAYSELLNMMVDSWRKAWDKNFPFYYVQIAPFHYGNHNVGALIREEQTKSMNHGKMGMVVISDLVDDTTNIHPKNKKDPALRLAAWALADTYHREGINYKSPFFKSMSIEKGKAIIEFETGGSELVARDKKISQLFVAGTDKIFHPADASIDHGRLIVWNKQVSNPVAVRYGFSNAGIGNLFNKNGLPVGPFRTDNWEIDVAAN
jgi:sialate O-acetylesterase